MAAPTSAKTAKTKSGKSAAKSRAAEHQVATLVELVRQSSATLFRDSVGRAQITFSVSEAASETAETSQNSCQNHRETHLLRSPAARHWIAQLYQTQAGVQPAASHLQAVLNRLEDLALHEREQLDVHLRLAEHEGLIYLDLADDQWRAIEIDRTGWRVVAEPPVRFRRSPLMLPLPEPQKTSTAEAAECRGETTGVPSDIQDDNLADVSGADDETTESNLASPPRSSAPSAVNGTHCDWPAHLRSFINVYDEHWPLVLGWLVAALRPRGPYPILCLHGEQGSAKSTAALLLRSLIDPSTAPHRGEPRQIRDLAAAASTGHVVCLDNLSRLPDWLSNALCRLSTGAGQTQRTDSDGDTELVFAASRPSMLVGVDPLAARGDLVDRALLVPLRPIDPTQRRTEAEIHERFASVRIQILAGLCDAVSTALANLPTTRLARLPRMADFAVWATAAEPALGLAPGEFFAAYEANRDAVHQQSLEASPLIWAISDLLHDFDCWTGTATLLLMILESRALDPDLKDGAWPRNPRALSSQLRRLAPALRTMRVEVEFDRGDTQARVRELTLRRATMERAR